jgi:cellulose synthase/poly-beta-1,6-N-acetylglucosamine synthase-like glycosyltransferase
MTMLHSLSYLFAGLYALAVTLLAIYGLHSLWLLRLFLKHRHEAAAVAAREDATPLPADMPRVLVQLPVFNERDVVTRVVAAIGLLDWPKDKLTIQLLDDSTDDSVEMGVAACAALRAQGIEAVSIHRTDRTGYKAGALENGMKACDAPFIAIFDADFTPNPDFLKVAIKPLLADPGLALVQGRWDHLNRDENLLTKAQALGIDGHFAIEQGARAWSGLAMNFNGTCGLWRREAIQAGGGWEHDTLTEDMDLSYRVQLKGWRCTYRLGLAVPGEIPASLSAWRSQQFRWAKGSIQTAGKLLPRIWRSQWSLHAKFAATLHMTHYCVHPLILLSLVSAPPALVLAHHLPVWVLMFGLLGFVVGAGSPILLYATSQWVLKGRAGWRRLRVLPALASIGTGIAISNTIAVWEALIGRQSAFVRTPKTGGTGKKGSYKASMASGIPELLCAGWAALGLAVGLNGTHSWIAPLMALYISGFLWVAWFSLKERAVAVKHQLNARSALTTLIPAGLAGLGVYALLAHQPGGYHANPALFAGLGLCLGALYVLSVWSVRRRPGGAWTLAWIAGITIAIRLVAFGMPAGENVSRAIVEGRQMSSGQNPYLIPPAHPDAFALVPERIDEAMYEAVPHAGITAANPPLMQWAQSLITEVSATPHAFKVVATVCELLCLALVMALVVRMHLPPAMIIAASWHPIGPLFFTGEGHTDALMAVPLVLGVLLAHMGRRQGGLVAATCSALLRPFGAVALLPQLLGRAWYWWTVPALVAIAAYVPFAAAGLGVLRGLGDHATSLHFHGPLEPVLRLVIGSFVRADLVQPAVLGALAALFLAGTAVWATRAQRDPQHPAHTAHMLALLAVCLPTVNPWYLLPLVLLLPFTASWGLLFWTAAAPMWWLHALGEGTELWWVTSLAHLPALTLLGWEALGRPLPWRRPVEVGAQPA